MRNRKLLILAIFIVFQCITLLSNAQTKQISIGERVPDFEFKDILFYAKKSLKLSDLKGKLIILDFWAPSCTSCIQAMPELDRLQKQFGDKIVILPVVNFSRGKLDDAGKERIQTFWKKNSFTRKTSLPTVLDTVLADYFPHPAIPYEVWINGDGYVVGLTQFISEGEIRSVLEGNKVSSTSRFADMVQYDIKQPLLQLSNNQLTKNMWYSAVMPYVKSVGSGGSYYQYDSLKNISRITVLNKNISLLLTAGNTQTQPLINLRSVLEVKDKEKYIKPRGMRPDDWYRGNGYGYESVAPGKLSELEMLVKMRDDVKSFFKLEVGLQQRFIDCWALVRISNNDSQLFSKKKENLGKKRGNTFPDVTFYSEDTKVISQTHTTINDLITSLNFYQESLSISGSKGLPVIDETGISFDVRLLFDLRVKNGKIDKESFSNDLIKPQLKQYGLDIIPVKRKLEVLVITEKDYKNEKSGK